MAIIKLLIVLEPNHYLNKDENKTLLNNMAETYLTESERYGISPIVFVVNNFLESDFKETSIGAKNEIGFAQVHGRAKRLCVEKGFDIYSQVGGIRCSAYIYNLGYTKCRSIKKAFGYYVSGKCNGSQRSARYRYAFYKKWERYYEQRRIEK